MNPLKRNNPGVRATDHEDRIQALERRYSTDFPLWYSILLGDLSGATGPGTEFLGWAGGGNPCPGPEAECLETVYTDGEYLLLPTGYNAPFEVNMQVGTSGSALANYLEPVTPGDDTPTNDMWCGFIAEIFTNNASTGTVVTGSHFKSWGQVPPPDNAQSQGRLLWHYRVAGGGVSSLDPETDRWALRPYVFFNNVVGGITVAGLTFCLKMLPPDCEIASAQWS